MALKLEPTDKWVTIDPGETVGWACWEGHTVVQAGQTPMWEYIDDLWDFVRLQGLKLIVCEDWALYPWVMADHGMDYDPCRTARAIGAITFIARHTGTNVVLQPAKIKEAALAAGAENYFVKPPHPNRHANDAIMHGVYYLATTQGVRLP